MSERPVPSRLISTRTVDSDDLRINRAVRDTRGSFCSSKLVDVCPALGAMTGGIVSLSEPFYNSSALQLLGEKLLEPREERRRLGVGASRDAQAPGNADIPHEDPGLEKASPDALRIA